LSLWAASKKVTANLKKQKPEEDTKGFSDIVSQYLNKPKPEDREGEREEVAATTSTASKGWGALKSKKPLLVKKETHGAIPLNLLRNLVREEKMQAGG
jgi:hypothetical protein